MRSSPGGCGNSGDEPNSACLEREAMAKDHGQDFSLVGIGSALRGNLNRVVLQTVVFFKTVERNSVSLFSNPYLSLHVYMYVYFGAKSRTSSNRSEDSW